MKYLIDTQVGLWWLTGSRRLSKPARARLQRAVCALSVVSVWEVDLKHELGKLPVAAERFRDGMVSAGASVLPLMEEHVLASLTLPRPHGDPFDRLLLKVALHERLVLLTADQRLIDLGAEDPRLPVEGV